MTISDPGNAPRSIEAETGATRIRVSDAHGDVLVGEGLIERAGEIIPPMFTGTANQILIVHAPPLAAIADDLRASLEPHFSRVLIAEIPDAESAKRIEVASFCWQILGQADFTRTDGIVTLGGGATTDLAGFVAASWLRGVRVVHIPTTVLGMADAAVGGKTGVNTAEGKNMVGAFHPPAGVVCDLGVLESLSENERTAGFAEVVKCGFIAEPEILDIVESDPVRALDPSSAEFRRALELAIGVKARVVGQDFTERGLREILNYGHTLGHAIEHAERYQWRHGAAVSIGMVFAAELARMSGRLGDTVADRHRAILESLGLPVSYPGGRWPTLLATMRRDKKARGNMLRFIVLDDVAKPAIMQAPDETLLFSAYQEIAA